MAQITRTDKDGFVVKMKSGKETTFTLDEFDYENPQVGDEVAVTRDEDENDHVSLTRRPEAEPTLPLQGQGQQAAPMAPEPPSSKTNDTKKAPAKKGKGTKLPFYKRTWFLVLMIVCFPIVGLILLLTSFRKRYKRGAWIALVVITSIFVLFRAIVYLTPSNSSRSASSETQQATEAQEQASNATDGNQEAEGSSDQQSSDINEALPDGYAFITPADLQKYSPNLSGVNVYTVAQVDDVEEDQIQITLDSGFMMSDFKTSTDYTSVLSDDETIAIYGTVDSYHDYGSMGTSVELSDCHVFATGDAASGYAKDTSDESLSQYLTLTGEVANASGDDLSQDDYMALCTTPDYESIMRNPDEYEDAYVKVTGSVDQVMEGFLGTYTLYIVDGAGNKWDVTYYYSDGESHVLEGDNITVYGQCNGTSNSTTVLGKQVTMPSVTGKYIVS